MIGRALGEQATHIHGGEFGKDSVKVGEKVDDLLRRRV